MLGRLRRGHPLGGPAPGFVNRLFGARTGELAVELQGDHDAASIPADPCGPTAHAGHLGIELRDSAGAVVVREGRSFWLCLEHNVAVRAPRS